ncbi:MAG: cysteine hydrolase [Armatimonadota bacterium]|nr:cysteine hydrolase [Armatimonadota bacterium]MDR7450614.1 cysteine hydrolase [Armatimonadota bacterium]MDR7466253.1 cysteine hydrolase [Armatimonadota bacterium]MDR7492974.1 cysteine hydrolase [Armatimonadota bacterium]MDR7498269.1 cysteine hydrolase [Armatimonadota bacterium]
MGQEETVPDRREMLAAVRARLSVDPTATALVLVDAHRGHLDPDVATMPVAPEEVPAVRGALARLVRGARAAGVPVVHVVMTHRRIPYPGADSMTNPFWRAVEEAAQTLTPGRRSTIRGHNLEGSVQTEILPELGPEPADYVIRSKKRLSAFYGTDLEFVLRTRGIRTVILAGINTNTCVLCTAFDAFNRDYAVIVARDAVASMYGPDLHRFGLENVSRCLGWVLTTDEILEVLGARAAAEG